MLALDLRAFILTIIYYISLALKVQLFCSIHLYSSSATKYQMSGRENLHSLVQTAIIKKCRAFAARNVYAFCVIGEGKQWTICWNS